MASRASVGVLAAIALAFAGASRPRAADDAAALAALAALAESYASEIQPLVARYCEKCHGDERAEADIDLAACAEFAAVRKDPRVWQRVDRMLSSVQMPPPKARQPSDDERARLRRWVREYLTAEARARAGDPGRVVLRRLSNSEYTHSVRDLTGVESLDPAHEFPVDGAAGEGFTNTGDALVMSPSLVTKYLDAAKEVASHAVLLPDGVRFSSRTTRRDETDEVLARIREFYRRYTDPGGRATVTLQGIELETAQGGRVPLEKYLGALLEHRDALAGGAITAAAVACERSLDARYLAALAGVLASGPDVVPSAVLARLRARARAATAADLPALVAEVDAWQQALWKFSSIGHIGRDGGPSAWMEPVTPIAERREFAIDLPSSVDGAEIVVRFVAGDAGDGARDDHVIWRRPRLEGAGRPAIALGDVAGLARRRAERRRELLAASSKYLAAAARAGAETTIAELAASHGLDAAALGVWLDWLAIPAGGPVEVRGHFRETIANGAFIAGWGTDATPSVVANSSDEQVRIPGIARPHSVVVHPSPTLFVAVEWQSPIDAVVRVDARVADAHPECGNGVEWIVRHGSRQRVVKLGAGEFERGGSAVAPTATIAVRSGELVSLLIGPRRGEHSCDLTAVDLTITEVDGAARVWDLAADVSGDIVAANPHADRLGNERVWHFTSGEMATLRPGDDRVHGVPPGSLLARWQASVDPDERAGLARSVEQLALGPCPESGNAPDALLWGQLQAFAMPLDDAALLANVEPDPRFGKHPLGADVEADLADLIVTAPSIVEFRLPSELAAGRKLVAGGELDGVHGREGSVQLEVLVDRSDPGALTEASAALPITVAANSDARRRVETAFADFRDLFPAALCYERIVPVDEVVTLTLFYRQDEALRRLMLDDDEAARLDRLWDELRFISHEPLELVTAFEQISEFATQDRPDLVKAFAPLREPILARAAAFRERLIASEPAHVDAVLEFAARAWRRPLTAAERDGLSSLYRELRASEIAHDPAVRLLFARVLTSPAFLYKLERPAPGARAAPVTSHELATRLSYFLWSSPPDAELRRVADAGELIDASVLVAETRRMLQEARTRRLAVEFACQWLHVRDFDSHDEKNERLYPELAALRGAMYEETLRFFEDLFRNDGSILGILDADHTFVNGPLATHYGLQELAGTERDAVDGWRRVDGVRRAARGGILAMATVLATTSGASRTSPILRGNWVYETLLGERLPRPPPGVPQLPDLVPSGRTARELIELHSSAPECAKCHAKIDPYGFALERYDAIGRLRPGPVDTLTTLSDGTTIDGIDGLRAYLLGARRGEFVTQFCRKLLGYALGREVALCDEPLLDAMQRALAENGYRFGVAVERIVTSPQFREIRGEDASDEP